MELGGQHHASTALPRQRKRHAVNTKLGGHQSKSGRFVEERSVLSLEG